MLALGGFVNGSAVIIWALISPLGALLFDDISHALRWFLAFVGLVILSGLLQSTVQSANQLSPEIISFFFVANIIGPGSIVVLMVFYFVAQKNKFQKRSETLLLNMLPSEIAKALKHENRTIADHYDEASVLFADMVGFTQLSAELAPVQMVELLNELFSYFDSLLDKYGVEKIRTIGDNYMAVCGVPRPDPDHARALINMALDMRDFLVTNTFLDGRHISFRFGINSGALIAGVIGRKKFVYDVWGDAVNIASRMESHGSSGIIQITRPTYDLVKNYFLLESRGTINVKGKGELEVWFVIERHKVV
jgi:guanylate cyclase